MPAVNSTLKWKEDAEKFAATNSSSSSKLYQQVNRDEILFEGSDTSDESSSNSLSGDETENSDEENNTQSSFLNDLFSKNKLNSDTNRIKEMLEKSYKLDHLNTEDKSKCCADKTCLNKFFCGEISEPNLTNNIKG